MKFYLGAASKWVQEEAERRGIWQTLLDAGANPLARRLRTLHRPGRRIAGDGRGRNFRHQPQFQGPHGIARRASAIWPARRWWPLPRWPDTSAGRTSWRTAHPARDYTGICRRARRAEKVEILPGFPERVRGRLVFMPQDNVNTDAIYGKDYTYRDDMTPEMMAKVVMENYDPQFAARTQAGDVIVGGFNFGTGSSREQAVTCLKAKGIPLVIAASFSQTYLRNAYNNGFLVRRSAGAGEAAARAVCQGDRAKEKTIIPGDEIDIDFTSGRDHLARREVRISGAGQRAAVAGDRRGRGESGGEAVGAGLITQRNSGLGGTLRRDQCDGNSSASP